MEWRLVFHPRDSGNISGKRPASIHDHPDYGLPVGSKKAVRRVRKIGNFHINEAAVTRGAAQRRLSDDLLALFGGSTQPVIAHLIESGNLTLKDVKEAEKILRKLERREQAQ